jgi:hypothetical protein
MKINIKKICVHLCLSAFAILLLIAPTLAQTKQLLKRTTYKTENVKFGVGGTIAVTGAPLGSITIEGWQKNEVEISADIEVQAETEADLAQLAAVNSFVFDQTLGRINVISVGTNDKNYMKRNAKNFPKKLLAMPVRIDYKIKVPLYSDLEIDGGKGDFELSNVEGAMRINFLETNAKLRLLGGAIAGAFGGGDVNVEIPARSWRGQGVDIQLIKGTLNVSLPQNLNADFDASILRVGKIENGYASLKPREERKKFTEKLIEAKAGNGGAKFSFMVGDGDLKIFADKR